LIGGDFLALLSAFMGRVCGVLARSFFLGPQEGLESHDNLFDSFLPGSQILEADENLG